MTLTEDEIEWFEERAAIKEFDGGLNQEQAERQALKEIIQARNRQSSRV